MHNPLLSDLQPGQRGVVVRVSDSDPSVLRELSEARLLPGVTVEVVDVAADGSIRLRTARAGLQVSFDQARAVYVALEPATVSPRRCDSAARDSRGRGP